MEACAPLRFGTLRFFLRGASDFSLTLIVFVRWALRSANHYRKHEEVTMKLAKCALYLTAAVVAVSPVLAQENEKDHHHTRI